MTLISPVHLPIHNLAQILLHVLPSPCPWLQPTGSYSASAILSRVSTWFSLTFIYISWFLYLWLCWVFIAVQAFLKLWQVGATLRPWCTGFSLQWFRLLWSTDSRRTGFSSRSSWALEHRLSSCAEVQLLHDPRLGIEPVSPAREGRFFTTEPPWKPWFFWALILLMFRHSCPPPTPGLS